LSVVFILRQFAFAYGRIHVFQGKNGLRGKKYMNIW
jgi:hypothetical protein